MTSFGKKKKVHVDVIKDLKMRSFWTIWVAANPKGKSPYKRHREKRGSCKMEAETGAMLPQAKERPEPPEAGRSSKGSVVGPSGRVKSC
jgi:hypothetical protein